MMHFSGETEKRPVTKLLKNTVAEEKQAITSLQEQQIEEFDLETLDKPTVPHAAVLPPRKTSPSFLRPLDPLITKVTAQDGSQGSMVKWEWIIIVAILLIAALAHGINMFHFPYLEDDEGTYVSQAWAVINDGRLAYYTYWYDHAPAGWLFIALWNILTGGFHTFGPAINSGRMLMLLLQLASTFMVYRIARNISHKISVAVVASLLFALSPYGIYFHRRVLLDNITTFWMLLSILILLSKRLSLKYVWLSALALGIAILSKELTVFLFPVLIYLVYYRVHQLHRWFATVLWGTLVIALVSLYPLLAILNNELFPSGTLLGGNAPHVSLLTSLQYQASRGNDHGIFNPNSGFWYITGKWIQDEPMLVIGGSLCAIIAVLMIKKRRLPGIMGLATLSLWAFMGRGGEVLGFYLVPLLPLLAINIGLVFGFVVDAVQIFTKKLTRNSLLVNRAFQIACVALCLTGITSGYLHSNLGFQSNHTILWDGAQADAQNQATAWVEQHVPHQSRIIIDMYMWPDLYDQGYANAHYYWKAQADPAIRDTVFHNDWHNVDYIVTTDQMLSDIQVQHMKLLQNTLDNSTLLARFDSGSWPIEIRQVNKAQSLSESLCYIV